MRNAEVLILITVLALSGCQTPPPARPIPVRPVTSPPIVTPSQVRAPELVRTYTLGAYVDFDDPNVRHEGHVIHRLEGAATWNLSPTKPEPVLAAAEIRPVPPLPLPMPTATLQVISSPAPVPPPIAPPVAPAPPPPPPAVVSPVVTTPVVADSSPVVVPNVDGLVDLTAIAATSNTDDANPFAVRATGPDAFREISVLVSGVMAGPTQGALVNNRPLFAGENLDSLTLVRVEADAAIFRAGDHLLRLPVTATALRVRFSR
jgi:hypothetical protein